MVSLKYLCFDLPLVGNLARFLGLFGLHLLTRAPRLFRLGCRQNELQAKYKVFIQVFPSKIYFHCSFL